MVHIPKDRASFDKLDAKDKDKLKRHLLRINAERISSVLNPADARIKCLSKGLISDTKCVDHGLSLDRKNKQSVMFDLLEDIPRHHHKEEPPWWERLDTVFLEMDAKQLYRDMNPWEGDTDGASGCVMFDAKLSYDQSTPEGWKFPPPSTTNVRSQIQFTTTTSSSRRSLPSPRPGDGGHIYAPHTPLAHTVGVTKLLTDLCGPSDQGSLWRKLAQKLGLTLQDELNLKKFQASDIYFHLVDTYVERFGEGATVGSLTKALIELGDVGVAVVLQMEEKEVIQPLGRDGCEAGGVLTPRSLCDEDMVGGASALYQYQSSPGNVPFPSSANVNFQDASLVRDSVSKSMRDMHHSDGPTPHIQTECNKLSSGTAADVQKSGTTAYVLYQQRSAKIGLEKEAEEMPPHPTSIADNTKQPDAQSPGTGSVQEEQKALNTLPFGTGHADSAQCFLNDRQMECNEIPKPRQNINGTSEVTLDALSTEGLVPCGSMSASTTPKIPLVEDHTNTERHPLPGQSDQQSAPVIIHSHIRFATNVFVNGTMDKTEPASKEFDAGSASNGHQEIQRENNAPQYPEHTSKEPLPWDLDAHQTELKQMIHHQANNDSVSRETLPSPSSTTSSPDLPNEMDVYALTPAEEQDLRTRLSSSVDEDGEDLSETTSATKADHSDVKESKGFIPYLKSWAVELWEDCLSLE